MNNKKQSKPKLIVTNFEKRFASFTEMINEFKTLHPEMTVIFDQNDEEVLPKYAAEDVLHYFTQNEPDVIDRLNLPVSVSISANAVILKTAKFFSISWKFKYDREGNVTDLTAMITTFGRERDSDELHSMIRNLKDNSNGWRIITRDK